MVKVNPAVAMVVLTSTAPPPRTKSWMPFSGPTQPSIATTDGKPASTMLRRNTSSPNSPISASGLSVVSVPRRMKSCQARILARKSWKSLSSAVVLPAFSVAMTSSAIIVNMSRLPPVRRDSASQSMPPPSDPRSICDTRKPWPWGNWAEGGTCTEVKPTNNASSFAGKCLPARSLRGAASASGIVLQPSVSRTLPPRARHADRSSSCSVGRAIFLLPENVVHLILNLESGITSRKTGTKRNDWRSALGEVCIRLQRVKSVQGEDTSIRMRWDTVGPETTNLPDSRTAWGVWLLTRLETGRIGAPRLAGSGERRVPLSFVKIDRLVAGRHQSTDGVSILIPTLGSALQHLHSNIMRNSEVTALATSDEGDRPVREFSDCHHRPDEFGQESTIGSVRLGVGSISSKEVRDIGGWYVLPKVALPLAPAAVAHALRVHLWHGEARH